MNHFELLLITLLTFCALNLFVFVRKGDVLFKLVSFLQHCNFSLPIKTTSNNIIINDGYLLPLQVDFYYPLLYVYIHLKFRFINDSFQIITFHTQNVYCKDDK